MQPGHLTAAAACSSGCASRLMQPPHYPPVGLPPACPSRRPRLSQPSPCPPARLPAETDNYTVVYDPNTRESTEELFNFGNAVEVRGGLAGRLGRVLGMGLGCSGGGEGLCCGRAGPAVKGGCMAAGLPSGRCLRLRAAMAGAVLSCPALLLGQCGCVDSSSDFTHLPPLPCPAAPPCLSACCLQGGDYVMGEYVDITNVHGSRRQHDKPYVSPEAMAAPPPPGMLAALVPAPSKKRKSTCEWAGLGSDWAGGAQECWGRGRAGVGGQLVAA